VLVSRFAVRAHPLQADKADAAFILHPLRLIFALEGEEAKIATFLHDIVEDGEWWTLERLDREGFSPEDVGAIGCLTKGDGEPYEDFIDRASTNPIARRVKRVDLQADMEMRRLGTVTEKDTARLQRYHRNWNRLTGGRV